MNTRRIPFQFSTADPVARQRELEKRFGLQPTSPNMYIDVNNPLSMGTVAKETSSPRLQHRVPIFAEGYDQPLNSSVDSKSQTLDSRKPNVRVIPIEIEGADTMSPRHRTFSGSAGSMKDHCDNLVYPRNEVPHFKRNRFQERAEPLNQKHLEPRIFNIPIKVENINNKPNAASKPKSVDPTATSINRSDSNSKVKPPKKVEVESQPDENRIIKPRNDVEVLLKKIEDVLTEFKAYETGVVEFTGTLKDKQYKYLDEMLTRCMLRLDDIDTMGIEEVRLARKSAVKMIQASIDLLESKASVESDSTKASEVLRSTSVENSVLEKDINVQGNQVQEVLISDKSEIPSEMKIDLNANTNEDQSEIYVGIDGTDSQTNIASNIESASLNVCLKNKIDLSKTDNGSKSGEIQSVSLPQQQKSIPEVEMSVEMPPVGNDVEMLDENDLTSNSIEAKESLPLNKIVEKKDVEMLDVEDFSKESIAEIASDAVESVPSVNFDCSQQECITPVNSPSVYSNDSEMTDIQDTLDVPQCDVAEQISEQDKCSSSQLKKQDEILNDESINCCNEAS